MPDTSEVYIYDNPIEITNLLVKMALERLGNY